MADTEIETPKAETPHSVAPTTESTPILGDYSLNEKELSLDNLEAMSNMVRDGKKETIAKFETEITNRQRILEATDKERLNAIFTEWRSDNLAEVTLVDRHEKSMLAQREAINQSRQFVEKLKKTGDLMDRIEDAASEDELNLIVNEIVYNKRELLGKNCLSVSEYNTLVRCKDGLQAIKESQESVSTLVGTKVLSRLPEKAQKLEATHILPIKEDISDDQMKDIGKSLQSLKQKEQELSEGYIRELAMKDEILAKQLALKKEILDRLLEKAEIAREKFIQKRNMSSTFNILSGVSAALSASASFLKMIPLVNIIAEPLRVTSEFLKFTFLNIAYKVDTNVAEAKREDLRKHLESIRTRNMTATSLSITGTILLGCSFLFPPLLLGAAAVMTVSNLFASTAAKKELERELKFGNKDDGKPLREEGLRAKIASQKGVAAGSAFFTVACAAVVLSAVFPPAGIALGIVGLVFTGLSVISGAYSAYKSYKEKVAFAKAEKAVKLPAGEELGSWKKQLDKINHRIENTQSAKVETKLETKVETKVDAMLEAKVDTQAESKVDTKIDTKVDTKMDKKVDSKLETKADTNVEKNANILHTYNSKNEFKGKFEEIRQQASSPTNSSIEPEKVDKTKSTPSPTRPKA